MAFSVQIEVFPSSGAIPQRYTCDDANISPPISWRDAPDEVRSLALIVDDPDAPAGTFVHWILFDIPSKPSELVEGYDAGIPGTNDFGNCGYGGPCPPAGHGIHRYFFRLFGLDISSLGLKPGARRFDVETAMKGHILSEAKYMGIYERR